ncbi:MAG TPA: hypothetical protein VEJ18_06910 [Planctomycetota bacterium]|nr:hypothetical protein [Planctomycetota bacterium]
MPASNDLLFGKLAVEMRFCTAEQVERCVAIQSALTNPLPLGRHLVEEGYLTEDQHSKVLERQRQNLVRAEPASRVSKGDLLFGRLAVKEFLATEEEVNACVREQARSGDRRTLGEVMIARGILTTAEVEWLLSRQSKTIMRCAPCSITLTVHSTSKNPKKVACPRCKGPLAAVQSGEGTASDGEMETSVRHRPVPDGPKYGSAPVCRICEHPFIGPVGADGRVECQSCHVRFVP